MLHSSLLLEDNLDQAEEADVDDEDNDDDDIEERFFNLPARDLRLDASR